MSGAGCAGPWGHAVKAALRLCLGLTLGVQMLPAQADSPSDERSAGAANGNADSPTQAAAGAQAVMPPPGGTGLRSPTDPLESLNRQIYAFNMGLDRTIMLPVARAYDRYVPNVVQTGLRNAVSNLLDPYIAANNLLQGKPKEALSDLTRFALNTTVGIVGLADPATELGLEKHREDFGQTLGVWGVPPGAYMMLPVFGPSNVRDTIGFGVDIFGALVARFDQAWVRIGLGGLDLIQLRVRALPAQGLFEDALDPYLLIRDGYLQRRRSLIYDGEPPDAD